MTLRALSFFCALISLTSGCAMHKSALPKITTDQHSLVRLHRLHWPEKTDPLGRPAQLKNILLLPPLGIKDSETQRKLQQHLYSATQRHFYTPIKMVLADSSYAPYISKKNLIFDDGTINIEEIAFIGTLMNSSHILFPYVRELKPYHPQLLDIQLMLIDANTGKICAELTSVFDARESDVRTHFINYCMRQKNEQEPSDIQHFKIKSPDTFQAFVSEMCSAVMADELSL